MAKKLYFLVMLSMCLIIVEISCAQEESRSPEAFSPERDSSMAPSLSPEVNSPLPASASPEVESPAPEHDSQGDSPSQPPQLVSPSALSPYLSSPGPASVPAPSNDDDSDDDSEPETEYLPSPSPSPEPEVGEPDDIKASEESGDEYEDKGVQDSGMSGSQKAGIAIGVMLGVGAIVIGALVYKKRRDNMTRARYTYFSEGEFL